MIELGELEHSLSEAGVGVCEVDDASRVTWLSMAAAGQLGVSAHDALGQDLHEVLPRGFRVVRGPGRMRLICAVPSGSSSGIHVRDAAMEASASAIVITDSRGYIEYVNPAFCAMTGYSVGEIAGQHTRILKSGQQGDDVYRVLWATITSGVTWNGVLVNRRKDGSLYAEESTITPVRTAAGSVHYVAVKRDVTAQRSLEQVALRSERLSLIGELAASMAHDLANVLSPISSGVTILEEEMPRSELLAQALGDVKTGVERAQGLVRQLMDFVRGGQGLRVAINTRELLEAYCRQLARVVPRRIAFEVLIEPDVPRVVADSMQLYQLLLNLCLNAIDAMPEGGRLCVEAAGVAGDRGPRLELTVSDTGVGMPPTTLAHLFEPFFTTKAPGRGTGIGLATVKRIVEAHDGEVHVSSSEGKGTAVFVELPALPSTS